jgi:hypothetical protein
MYVAHIWKSKILFYFLKSNTENKIYCIYLLKKI